MTGSLPPPDLPDRADEAVTALFRLHAHALTGLAVLLVSDAETAEDVVQEAFLGLYRRWFFIRDRQGALGYLRTAVLNGARSRLRRRRTERAYAAPYDVAAPSAETQAAERAEAGEILACVDNLPRRQREVLVLRYHLDLSEAEIAAELGISRGAVKSHASRGLAALAQRMGATR